MRFLTEFLCYLSKILSDYLQYQDKRSSLLTTDALNILNLLTYVGVLLDDLRLWGYKLYLIIIIE